MQETPANEIEAWDDVGRLSQELAGAFAQQLGQLRDLIQRTRDVLTGQGGLMNEWEAFLRDIEQTMNRAGMF